MADRRKLIRVLKSELTFLEQGGYRARARYPWRPAFVFEDSPTCINYFDHEHAERRPCEECPLMEFVPADRRTRPFPCRHIDLTESGETVNSFYQCGTEQELEAALGEWFRKRIRELEGQDLARGQAI